MEPIMQSRQALIVHWRARTPHMAREVAHKVKLTESMLSKLENGHLPVTDETIGRYLRAELCSDAEAVAALRIVSAA